MRVLSVRELRNTIPHLRETLAQEHELLLVSNGVPVARILPIDAVSARPRLPDIRALRDAQPPAEFPIEAWLREDRDKR